MFPCMIARSSTIDVISAGLGGTRNGALQLVISSQNIHSPASCQSFAVNHAETDLFCFNVLQMHAELQVLSPLVPTREVRFLRFCKQHAEGLWAVVDVSIDSVKDSQNGASYMSCRRLPSGCVVQDMPNGYSKVNTATTPSYLEHQLTYQREEG